MKQRVSQGTSTDDPSSRGRGGFVNRVIWRQVLLLWAGWILPQVFLFGSSLIGERVLSPADLLATPLFYLPDRAEYHELETRDDSQADLVLVSPAAREFCAQEFRAGRLPLWQPSNYCGAPFATWPKYSPFELLYSLIPSPVMLSWMQLVQAVVIGSGMYLFLRRGLSLPYWPAATSSWCLPLSGFMVLWQGYPVTGPVCWMPWLLWSVVETIRRPFGVGNWAMAIVTAILLLTGQSDVGGLVLLTSGLLALWQIGTQYVSDRNRHRALVAIGGVTVAWGLGFLIAAPYLLPLVEYSKTGARIQARAEGWEDRPPAGWSAWPAIVLPEVYGSSRRGSLRLIPGNQMESTAAAYAGLIATFWLAPLAWCNQRRRQITLFWTLLLLLSLGWQLNVPGFVTILRLPWLNLLSYSRWVLASSMAILVLTAIGFEQFAEQERQFRRWFLIPMGVTAAFGIWCLVRSTALPEPIRSELLRDVMSGQHPSITPNSLMVIQLNDSLCFQVGAILCFVTLLGWGVSIFGACGFDQPRGVIPIILICELLWFASKEVRDADWKLYFPRLSALERLAKLPPGRMLGVRCLPPNLNQSHKLWDIRGYDAVDPARLVMLLDQVHDPQSPRPIFAKTQWLNPFAVEVAGQQRVPPILDLLNVRYLVFRQKLDFKWPIVIHEDDYWVVENPNVLPRAFVPRSVVYEPSDQQALSRMARANFNPREVAFLAENIPLSTTGSGEVSLREETPIRVELMANMQSDGVVVLSDLWDAGWQAELDGQSVPVHRANVALRGIVVPSGHHQIVLTYWPASLRLGCQLSLIGLVMCVGWGGGLLCNRRGLTVEMSAD